MSVILVSSAIVQVMPATAQLAPEPWVTIGARDSSITYGVGVRIFDFGVEFGTGPKGVTGIDALKFISLPGVSPYAGLGIYGGLVGGALAILIYAWWNKLSVARLLD